MRPKIRGLLSRFALSVVLLTCTSPAWSQVLNTGTVSNNGTGGVFSQVTAFGGSNLFIESFTTQLGNATVGTQADVEVWTRPGEYTGFTASNVGWTLQETIIGFSAGIAVNTPLSPLVTPILVEQGNWTSIYLHSITVGNGIRYFGTGTTSTANYSDANLALFTNISRTGAVPFAGGQFTPRAFSGTITYSLTSIPEPAGLSVLALLGAAVFGTSRRRMI